MSRESFITTLNCPVRWKRLARWREQTMTMDEVSEERKSLYKYINDLNFTDNDYYNNNNYVNEVSFANSAASVKVGETLTLQATVTPANSTNKALTWKSSKTSVATVVDGVVTGVAEGIATITATSTDGTKESAKCVVTVTAA